MVPIHLGFIGGGPRSNSIYSSIMMNRQFEDLVVPACMVDTNPRVREDWRYKVDETCSSLDQLLKHEPLDAVLIATPPATHASIAVKCLEAGLDVWSEVPMGLEMDELFAIMDAERANKGNRGRYALGENYCWHVGNQFARLLVSEGKMGELFYMKGVYHHSVEHYMIVENFTGGKSIDPELDLTTTPTWRATIPPIKYGHTAGPCLYVLAGQGKRDPPVTVSAHGNMKMQKRFGTDNFQVGTFQTEGGVICDFGSGFVLPDHGGIWNAYWGTRGIFETPDGRRRDPPVHYLYLVPKDQASYPHRHQQEGLFLSDDDLEARGAPRAGGGHGGADTLMFTGWLNSLLGNGAYEIDATLGAEMAAVCIAGYQSIVERKTIEVPRFS